MFAKTTAQSAAAARELMLKLHPYDLPCITALSVLASESSPAFLAWVASEAAAPA